MHISCRETRDAGPYMFPSTHVSDSLCALRFVNTNSVISEHSLTKLPELWPHIDSAEGMIYFALNPPWKKRRKEESFYALHPEMAKSGGTFRSGDAQGGVSHGTLESSARDTEQQQKPPQWPPAQARR